MKKRIVSLLLCFTMAFAVLSGCSNKTAGTGSTQMGNLKEASVIPVSDTKSEYQYNHDLNMIEDNNRNYYEIFVASYCDSNGDGVGDLNGIISKLDYIKDMGFNGIWLMPIMTSPSYHKYDTSDYYSVDPEYGTNDDFTKLAEECHKRGIKLIIDYVFNHSSNEHPWFTQAVKYLEGLSKDEEPDLKECPYVGYYHFTKDHTGSSGYHQAGNSDWNYECRFYFTQPDLALENTAVRKELEKVAKFWMGLGADGFRLDAAKEYFSGDTGKNVEVLKWFSEYVKSINPDAYLVGEVFDSGSVISDYYQSKITSLFNFPVAQYNGIIAASVRKLGTYTAKSFLNSWIGLNENYSKNNPDYIDAPFLSNHDTTRIAAQYANNEDQMKMAAGMLLTMNGSPFVYYGEEIGMNSQGDKDENKRLPMHWSDTDKTGLTTAPAGADKVVQKFKALDKQMKDPLSIVNYYKRALRIRNENPEIARGKVSIINKLSGKDVCAVKKVYNDSRLVIVYNISNKAQKVNLKNAGYSSTHIRGYMTVNSSAVTLKKGVLKMPLYSIVILK